MSRNPTDVSKLIDDLEAGREDVLAELFDCYRGKLRTMVALRLDRRLHGRVDPSDVLQEAYIDLASRLPDYQNKDMSFYVWLRLVVGERLLNIHRRHFEAEKRDVRREVSIRQRPLPNASTISLAAALLGGYSSVAGKVIRREAQSQLQEKIEQLDPADREIITLRSFEELSNDEAAEVLGISKYASSKRYVRALKRLRLALETIPGFSDFSRSSNAPNNTKNQQNGV